MTQPPIEFTGITPHMLYHPRVVGLPEIKRGTLAARIHALPDIKDRFALIHEAGAVARLVAAMETALDQITADAMADHQAAREADNVVRFRRRGE